MTSPAHPPQPAGSPARRRLLGRGTWREAEYIRDLLRTETVGGAILLLAAAAALLFANSPWRAAYGTLRNITVGPAALHLDLSLSAWASDGLLAIFFLVAGIELKREFTAGDLADPRKAALPIAAAVCGVAVPAILYAAVVTLSGGGGDVLRGWAIPTATDIAFALAVLAVIGTHLPSALRAFLLTLAVVDDLIAITIIALFYTTSLNLLALAGALLPVVAWHVLLRRRIFSPFVLAVPALLTWGLVHASGVHATVAGVLLGLTVPVSRALEADPRRRSTAERLEHRLRPFSAGVAVPVFAFFAAGVTVVGGGFGEALADPVVPAVVIALVVGKAVGILGGTWVLAKFTRAELDEDLAWSDVLGLSLLAGVGFTVSLLIGELAYGTGSPRDEHVRLAVLLGSLTAALLAAGVLRLRERHYRRVHARESADRDADGIPDVYGAQ